MPEGKLYKIVTQGGLSKPRVIGFDPTYGVGNTISNPLSVSRPYSFTRMMKPSQFLQLAYPLDEDAPHGYILKQLQKGRGVWDTQDFTRKFNPDASWKPNTIAPPELEVGWHDDHNAWYVRAHEGRHRSLYLQNRGDPVIPVTMLHRIDNVTSEQKRAPIIPQAMKSRDIPDYLDSIRGNNAD